MAVNWGSWGDLTFTTTTSPEKLQEQRRWKVVKHDLINAYPDHEFTGEDERTIQLTWTLNAKFNDPKAMYDTMVQAASAGEKRALAVGAELLGTFAIQSIGRDIQTTRANGKIIAMQMDVQMVEVRYD